MAGSSNKRNNRIIDFGPDDRPFDHHYPLLSVCLMHFTHREHSLSVSLLFLHLVTCISHRDFSFDSFCNQNFVSLMCVGFESYNIDDEWMHVG